MIFVIVPAYSTFDDHFPCHCEDDIRCDSINGSCETGCDGSNKVGNHWRGDWEGPGCQIGKYMIKMYICYYLYACL